MKMHFTKMLTVCCAILFGAFVTTDALAQGTDCSSATAVTPGSYTVVDLLDGALGAELNCFGTAPAGDHNAAWYSFTPAENGVMTVSSCQGGADTRLSVGTGACGALSCEASSDDVCPFEVDGTGPSFASQVVDVPVIGGETYLIQWDNRWSSAGFNWTLDFTAATEPDCEGVIGGPAVPGSSCDDGDANTVGDVYGEDCVCAGFPLTGDCLNTSSFGTVDAPSDNVLVTISTCSYQSEYSTINAVMMGSTYEFNIVGGGYATVRRDSSNGAVVAQGTVPVSYTSADGATLFVHWNTDGACQTAFDCVETTVECTSCTSDCPDGSNIGDACDDGDPSTSGETVQADCSCGGGVLAPGNDNCANAVSLDCDQPVDGTTVGATTSTGLNDLCNGFTSTSAEDVWYSFEADGTSDYTITVDTNAATASSLLDAVIFVYSGSCNDLVEIACADDNFAFGVFTGESLTLAAPAAGTYYARVYNWNLGGELFTITLTCEGDEPFVCGETPLDDVDETSLSTTFTGSGYLLEWAPVANQIGCQVQVGLQGGPNLGSQIVGGASASSLNVPGGLLQPGTDYQWRVRCGCSQTPIVATPWTTYQPFTTPGGSTIVSQPNPTEGQSNVTFTVIEEGYTTLEVFDMSGRLVDAIFTGTAVPGADYRFEFDGTSLPNGVYLYRLTTDKEVVNEKFMIAR